MDLPNFYIRERDDLYEWWIGESDLYKRRRCCNNSHEPRMTSHGPRNLSQVSRCTIKLPEDILYSFHRVPYTGVILTLRARSAISFLKISRKLLYEENDCSSFEGQEFFELVPDTQPDKPWKFDIYMETTKHTDHDHHMRHAYTLLFQA